MDSEETLEAVASIEAHIASVRDLLLAFGDALTKRAEEHDRSKLEEPEFALFAAHPRDTNLPHTSPEYMRRLARLGPALEHHYRQNRHHPEHFTDSTRGMNLLDVIEMLVDWRVTNAEHGHSDFVDSIEHQQKRFGFGEEMKRLLLNTAELLDELTGDIDEREVTPCPK